LPDFPWWISQITTMPTNHVIKRDK